MSVVFFVYRKYFESKKNDFFGNGGAMQDAKWKMQNIK